MKYIGLISFSAALAAGFLIWQMSEVITGYEEAFDAIFYYIFSLFILGIALFRMPMASYFGVAAGQLLFFYPSQGKLWAIGVGVIIILSLITPLAGFLTNLFIKGYQRNKNNMKQ